MRESPVGDEVLAASAQSALGAAGFEVSLRARLAGVPSQKERVNERKGRKLADSAHYSD